EQQLRQRQAERLGSLHIDDQLERRRLLEWQLGGVFAFQNPVDVIGGFVLRGGDVWSIRHQAAPSGGIPGGGRSRDALPYRKFDDLAHVLADEGVGEDKKSLGPL